MPADSARSYAVYSDAVAGAILLLKFEQIEPLGASPTKARAGVEPGSAGLEALAKRLRLPHKAVLLMQMRPDRTNKY